MLRLSLYLQIRATDYSLLTKLLVKCPLVGGVDINPQITRSQDTGLLVILSLGGTGVTAIPRLTVPENLEILGMILAFTSMRTLFP
jgi:hypothetical protein